MLFIRLAWFCHWTTVLPRFRPLLFPSCSQVFGVNPSVETNSLGTLAVFIQPSFYLLAGDGVWGRGRRLSLLRFIGNAPRPLPAILIPHP